MYMKIYYGSEYSSYDRHIIWKCQYLDFPLERLSKKDRNMVLEYFRKKSTFNRKIKEETLNIYSKKEKSRGLEYEKIEESSQIKTKQIIKPKKKIDKYEEYKVKQAQEEYKKMDKYEKYKFEMANREKKEKQKIEKFRNQVYLAEQNISKNQEQNFNKNQILKF